MNGCCTRLRHSLLKIPNARSCQLLRPYCQNEPKDAKNPKKLPSIFTGYDNSLIDVKDLPFDVVRRTKTCATLHLLDQVVAKEFASLIMDEVMDNNEVFIAEINPGIGLVTQELLKSGIPVVHGYEKYTEFMQWLHPLMERYSGRLQIRPFNLLTIGKTDFIDGKTNSKNMDKIFEGLEARKWCENPAMVIIGPVPSMTFFYSLQWSLINNYLSDYGRAVLYCAISPSMSLVINYIIINCIIIRAGYLNYDL